jgi:hypothetical protein
MLPQEENKEACAKALFLVGNSLGNLLVVRLQGVLTAAEPSVVVQF